MTDAAWNTATRLSNATTPVTANSYQVMSDKLQSIASDIYQEMERMIDRYDEGVVRNLMPLVVNVLECLDLSYTENQEQEVELELLREDNEQLVTQYEREKYLRRSVEQKTLEIEDSNEDHVRSLNSKIESIQSIVRMFELKRKNTNDHVARMEERIEGMKCDYNNLQTRYTNLWHTHLGVVDRYKALSCPVCPTSEGGPAAAATAVPRTDTDRGRPSERDLCLWSGVNPHHTGCDDAAVSDSDDVKRIFGSGDHSGTRISAFNWNQDMSMEDECLAEPASLASSAAGVNHVTSTNTTERRSKNILYQEICYQGVDSIQENEEAADMGGGDSFYGMGKEINNLIKENDDLLATKNALNVVKDDLIAKVDELSSELSLSKEQTELLQRDKLNNQTKITELEEELKQLKEDLVKLTNRNDNDDDIPMAQKKRFTRVEMARVLMERNKYKELYMELQENIRYKASLKANTQLVKTSNSRSHGLWRIFSRLFSSSDPGLEAPENATEALLEPRLTYSQLNDRLAAYPIADTMAASAACDDVNRRHAGMRITSRIDTGCRQAYGWSLPETCATDTEMHVPVPVYCRPLNEKHSRRTKFLCAATIDLSGGVTRDGGNIVGASVFYSQLDDSSKRLTDEDISEEVNKLNSHLCKSMREDAHYRQNGLSSYVWICSSTREQSQVIVVDASSPSDVLHEFCVAGMHVDCLTSVPGVRHEDYDHVRDLSHLETVPAVPASVSDHSSVTSHSIINTAAPGHVSTDTTSSTDSCRYGEDFKLMFSFASSEFTEDKKSISELNSVYVSALPTVWMGTHCGHLRVHSALYSLSTCIANIQLPDSIVRIVYSNGFVLVTLANGVLLIFCRKVNGSWNFDQYHQLRLSEESYPIRCLIEVSNCIWCARRNFIHIFDSTHLQLQTSFEAHPRRESQVSNMTWLGDGVWVSVRFDSTLRLFHAYTHEHLQDIDVEPCISRVIGTCNFGFSLVRISTLSNSYNRLWVGTANGIILLFPLNTKGDSHSYKHACEPGSAVRIYTDVSGNVIPSSFVPYCDVTKAQVSFHGHKEAVRFFLSVPESYSSSVSESDISILVMSGGVGYVDFRVDESCDEGHECFLYTPDLLSDYTRTDRSHIIVWHMLPINRSLHSNDRS